MGEKATTTYVLNRLTSMQSGGGHGTCTAASGTHIAACRIDVLGFTDPRTFQPGFLARCGIEPESATDTISPRRTFSRENAAGSFFNGRLNQLRIGARVRGVRLPLAHQWQRPLETSLTPDAV